MAMLFDLDAQRGDRFCGQADSVSGDGDQINARPAESGARDGDPVDVAFELIRDHIGGLEPQAALVRIRGYRNQLAALETSVVAKLAQDTGSDRAAKRLLNDGKTSKRAISKAAKRGDAAAKNAGLVDKMAAGDLSEEHVDVIADADAKTGGAAAVDEKFIDSVAGVDPDQAQNIADQYVADKADTDGTQTEHDRQRTLRRASKYVAKKNGLDTINIEGDAVAAKNMWAQIQARADEIYQADGGRDLATGLHARTREQRLFDAAHELICGVTTTPTGTTHKPRHASTRGSVRLGRPQIFVGITLDKYLGLDPTAMAVQIGLGAIPDTVLAEYLEHADIISALYDHNGQPLWIGRTKRHATQMQRYALIARDKHCVLCNAPHSQCDAHHLMPWNAPDKGQTNLNNLALLCGPCHRQLHAANHTLYQNHTTNTWHTRPATPNETPPPQPNYTQRE